MARTLMSTHMEGPRTAGERSIARRAHEKREQKRRQQERSRGPSWLDAPTIQDVARYLKNRGSEVRGSGVDLRPRDYEPALHKDLMQARAEGDEKNIRSLRELILAGSRRVNHSTSPRDAYVAAQELIEREQREQMRHATHDPEETREREESIQALRRIADAIHHERIGDVLEDAVRDIEYRFMLAMKAAQTERTPLSRQQANRDLSRHRIVRDEMYESRLYPDKIRTRNALMQKSSKPPPA